MTQADYCRYSGLSRGQVCKLTKAGMPLESPEAADAWRGSSARKKPSANPLPGPFRPPESDKPVDTALIAQDSPQGAYERQKQIERAAYALAAQSLRNRTQDAGRMVSVHASAAKNHDGAVAQLLKAMPKQLAVRISPHDPEHAERELDQWVQDVALKTLHQTDPWK